MASPDDVAIVFAPSGTDLEYVALACVAGRAPGGTHAILLGADEVGSGCIHSAHGLYFADETALGVAVAPGEPVPGLGGVHVDLIDIPVRDRMGAGAALDLYRRADARPRSPPPAPPAGTASSISSTARRPG